jgi:hypothetical protein
VYPQQTIGYQQTPPFYAPPVFNPLGLYQQANAFPPFQMPGAPVPNAVVAKNKRKKKKNGGSANVPTPPLAFELPQIPYLPLAAVPPLGGGTFLAGPSVVDQLVSVPQAADDSDVVASKPGKCWKCAVDTHATKDCKAQHYCLVCDTAAHPTLRCPTLKLPKPQAFVAGSTCEESLCLRLPDGVYKAHLAPKGLPTTLVKISAVLLPLRLFRMYWLEFVR